MYLNNKLYQKTDLKNINCIKHKKFINILKKKTLNPFYFLFRIQILKLNITIFQIYKCKMKKINKRPFKALKRIKIQRKFFQNNQIKKLQEK